LVQSLKISSSVFVFLKPDNLIKMRILSSLLLCLTLLICCNNRGYKTDKVLEGKGIIVKNGMVVSAHPEASKIGVQVLMEGGNAFDAAVATGFALAVCYPEAGNLGGGGFMVLRTSDGNTDAIDYREKAPLKASSDMYIDSNGQVISGSSTDTHLSSGVPGSVDGLISVHMKYGRLPFRKVIQPSIMLATKGYRISAMQAVSFNENRKYFVERNIKKPAFVKDSVWKEGDMLVQPDLAATLRRIRDKGREGFYSGRTAELIIKEMERGSGLISLEDLAEYKSVWREPISSSYKGYKITTMSPPSGGGVILLQLLGMIEKFEPGKMGFNTPDAVHLIAEAEKRAFADRSFYLGDPDFVKIPLEQLLDKKYLDSRMSNFDNSRAVRSAEITHGSFVGTESEETTHYSVVDSEGNAASVTTTLNGTFGNLIVVNGAGFILNNEMDDFSVKPGFPNMFGLIGGSANSIQPAKRMLSSMTPAIVENEGELYMVAGSPGGSNIPSAVFQVVINVMEYGMNIQEAVEAGRFHHQWIPDYISYEENSLDSTCIRALTDRGHTLRKRGSIGRVNAIMRLPSGELQAGADPRGKNAAAGF
jgi:gamma-glutamyltranspeptidase / glutathione hydrolase